VPGTLYVVATPIGNLQDMTLRAIDTLKAVDGVICEDTRVMKRLLSHFGIRQRTTSFFTGNERVRLQPILQQLREDRDLALASDAGTPGISDPGFLLVAACRKEDIPVVPVPGPSALSAGLSVCGLPTSRVLFLGFPSRKQGERKRLLNSLAREPSTLVFYESPKRIRSFYEEARLAFPDREAIIEREMTKAFESHYANPDAGDLPEMGEYILIFGPPGRSDAKELPPRETVEVELRRLVSSGLDEKEALRTLAREWGHRKRDLYQLVKRSPH